MTEQTPTLEGIILAADADSGALVQVQPLAAKEFFTAPVLVKAALDKVRAMALDGYAPDVTTDKGRKAIASQAYKVAQTKTALDAAGKTVVDHLKALPKMVDDGRKALRDGLDALRDEIRRPLTVWEARQEELKGSLARLQAIPARMLTATANEVEEVLGKLEGLDVSAETWEAFAGAAAEAKAAALGAVQTRLQKLEQEEADRQELDRLRREKAERDAEAGREQLRKEGEARALAALQAQPADPATEDLQDALARTAAARAAAGAHVPMLQEPQQPAAAPEPAPTPGPAAAALAPDVEHRRTFNREALADLTKIMSESAKNNLNPEEAATAALRAIVTGQVRHVGITY